MSLIVPSYYTSFSCIGSQCKHNCCIGWEIDIDDFSLSYYKSIGGSLGLKLKENIIADGFDAHFILSKDGRCPFLTPNGLCEIITEMGEDALCDICALHPRFRNFYSDRVEMGLGLCCEEAAKIIISNKKPVSFINIERDNRVEKPSKNENLFFAERGELFAFIENDKIPFLDKISFLSEKYNLKSFTDASKVIKHYASLEHLTKEWPKLLEGLISHEVSFDKLFLKCEFNREFSNLLHYFIFRHFCPTRSEVEKCATIGVAILSIFIIGAICDMKGKITIDELIDISRLYSSEIEYSDINFKSLVNLIKEDYYVR